MYNYEECLGACMVAIKRYNTARNKVNEWDYFEFQDIRDELSESLVYFGPHYADLRADAEQAEIDRKTLFETRKLHWKEELAGERGKVSTAESKAFLDCTDAYANENKAKREYYKARSLIDRIDQVMNSVASRLKPIEKYDTHE